MPDKPTTDWVLPASIPFAELKRKDLEECVYWLFDAMGAKDLEWRTGGSGDGAPDGGRDLEAKFYTPGADSEIESQTWWIECKGRKGTVEPSEVQSAIVNAQAKNGLDYLVIATNTQFSNPTRDWAKEWGQKNPRPKIKLWDSAHLERLLSRYPEVVLRLFSEALSLDGRFKAMESRFWNKLEFVVPKTLSDLWKARKETEFTARGIFAAIANEFANGDITHRSWAAHLSGESLLDALGVGLVNTSYLAMRSYKNGIDQKPITRALAYLILCALEILPSEAVAQFVTRNVYRDGTDTLPDNVKDFLLMPIVDQLLSEIQDICTSDCRRIISIRRKELTEDNDEVDTYWLRFEPSGIEEDCEEKRYLRIESTNELCKVGFPVDKDNGCPLFRIEPAANNVDDLLAVIKRVAAYRKGQAADERQRKAKQS